MSISLFVFFTILLIIVQWKKIVKQLYPKVENQKNAEPKEEKQNVKPKEEEKPSEEEQPEEGKEEPKKEEKPKGTKK